MGEGETSYLCRIRAGMAAGVFAEEILQDCPAQKGMGLPEFRSAIWEEESGYRSK
jgi:hypothetical protein